ncbi:hydroxyethylthiazole kinase [Peribacillus sp. SCS-155]|uniref:hydroxyethylthiazole kinase n=1 Tax=Peribacillus sedimenti TaxID=3115297 RepID=UPI003906849D
MIEDIKKLFSTVQQRNPLVHQITNTVTINDCANVTLAIGGSPVMASSPEEAEDMVKIANALVINFGTLDDSSFEAMLLAGKTANQLGIPVVFDPVGAGATPFRTKRAVQLLQEVRIGIIRGNASEMNSLIGGTAGTRGVDSGNVDTDITRLAMDVANQFHCVAVISGARDVISNGSTAIYCDNGHPFLTKITGSGCMATALIGVFAGAAEDMMAAAVAGISVMSLAGEMTFGEMQTPVGAGTFRVKLMDCISTMTDEIWENGVKLVEIT